MMHDFLFKVVPNETFDGWANYKNNTGCFRKLFDQTQTFDTKRFWHIASLDEKALCQFAFSLVELPATIKKIDVTTLRKLISKSELKESETFKAYLTSLFLNDK